MDYYTKVLNKIFKIFIVKKSLMKLLKYALWIRKIFYKILIKDIRILIIVKTMNIIKIEQ